MCVNRQLGQHARFCARTNICAKKQIERIRYELWSMISTVLRSKLVTFAVIFPSLERVALPFGSGVRPRRHKPKTVHADHASLGPNCSVQMLKLFFDSKTNLFSVKLECSAIASRAQKSACRHVTTGASKSACHTSPNEP